MNSESYRFSRPISFFNYCEQYRENLPHPLRRWKPYLDRTGSPALFGQHWEYLQSHLTQSEIEQTFRELNLHKPPFPDCFLADGYLTFWDIFYPSSNLCTCCGWKKKSQRLPESMSVATITLIHKPGKEPLDCANYRHISLINIDAM